MAEEKLESQKWYHPNLSRQQAEEILKTADPGTFVVRPSASQPNCFALSYRTARGDLAHSLVQKTPLGYKLPEESPVYPTMSGLLKTCKFLAWEEPPSDQNIAIISEAFPNASNEEIVKALKATRNDVVSAIDYLLTRENSAPSKTTTAPSKISTPPTKPAQKPVEKPVERPPENRIAKITINPLNEIETAFKQLSLNAHSNEIHDQWMKLERPTLVASLLVSSTLESNLTKILQNNGHPMGKKIDNFSLAFKASYDSFDSPDSDSNYPKAVQDINSFIASMHSSITSKVQEFATPAGSIIVWKAVQAVIMQGCFSPLFQTFQRKYEPIDTAKEKYLSNLKTVNIANVGVQPKFLLPKQSSPYIKAIESLQGLSFVKNCYDKLNILVQTCILISDSFTEYNVTYHPENSAQLVTTEELLPIFTYALCRAQVPYVYSELQFMKEFIHAEMKRSFEGFALSTFEVAVNNLDKLSIKVLGSMQPQKDLLEFDDFRPDEPQQRPISISSNRQGTLTNTPSLTNLASTLDSSGNYPILQNSNAPEPEVKFETLKRAEKAYVNALKQMKTVDAYNQLAVYYNTKGKFHKAIMYCNQALTLDPGNETAKRNIVLYTQNQQTYGK